MLGDKNPRQSRDLGLRPPAAHARPPVAPKKERVGFQLPAQREPNAGQLNISDTVSETISVSLFMCYI